MRRRILVIILFSMVLIKYVLGSNGCAGCIGWISISDKSERTNILKKWNKRKWMIGLKSEFLTAKSDLGVSPEDWYNHSFPAFTPSFSLKFGLNSNLFYNLTIPTFFALELSRGLNYNVVDEESDSYYIRTIKGNIFWWKVEMLYIFKSLSKQLFSPYFGLGGGVKFYTIDSESYKKESKSGEEVLYDKEFSYFRSGLLVGMAIIGFESFIYDYFSLYLELKFSYYISDPFSEHGSEFHPPFLGVGTYYYF